MTNAGRNSIVLSSLLVMIVSVAVFLLQSTSKRVAVMDSENKASATKLAKLENMASNIDSLMLEYEVRKAMAVEQSKVILAEDNPTITYQYLLRVLNWLGRDILYDFALSPPPAEGEQTANNYVISGRTNYMDLANFTRQLEHQRALLTLEEFSIGSDGVANSDTVSFSMVLRSHFSEGGLSLHEIKRKEVKAELASYQLFRSRIWDTIQYDEDTEDPRLLNIDTSRLIGVAVGRVFLRDSQGVIRILNLRDKVWGGYLYGIDVREGKAIFKVDKFGLPENQTLYLSTEN